MQFTTLTLMALAALTVTAQQQDSAKGNFFLPARDDKMLEARKGGNSDNAEAAVSGSSSSAKNTPTPTPTKGSGSGSKATPSSTAKTTPAKTTPAKTTPAKSSGTSTATSVPTAGAALLQSNAGGLVTIAGMGVAFALFM